MFSENFNRGEKLSTLKSASVQYGILLIMLALGAGLWRLQVLGASNFKELAEENRIRKEPIMAPRGKLLDRDGRLLVDNYPSVSCFLVREQNKNLDADLPLIAQGLHLDLDQLQATLKHFRAAPGYQPIPIKQDISPDEQAFIEAHRNELPELETIDMERRLYPRDGFAAHLIGYVGEVSEEDLNNNPRFAAYEPGQVVGKAGVEATYDQILRGEDGSRDVIVDSHGREMGYLRTQHSTPGQDLKLTIDLDIQRTAELALGEANGAVVVMDPRNGEVLALVSHPSYDPNAFAVKIKRDDWNKLITDPRHPLMNKAIQDQLAPGSTFKIIMSAAGLQEGVAQDMRVNCQGGGSFYGRFFKCDKHHGVLAIQQAIPLSCDTFFYALAQKLGIDTIARYATSLGLSQKTGIDLPNEMAGIMPSTQWEWHNYHQKYYAGNTISVGIGQGETQVTPIQLVRALSGIASNGHLVRPHLVDPGELPAQFRTAVYDTFPGSAEKSVSLDNDTWMTITDGMAAATTSGTAAAAHINGVDFAGKTGTAQVVGGGDTHTKGGARTPNSWFVGMVPRRNPEIAVVVLQEHGDWGANSALIAQKIIITYVNKKRSQDHNLLQQAGTEQKPVEVGAVWSNPEPADPKHGAGQHASEQTAASVSAGHFFVNPAQASKDLAATPAASLFPAFVTPIRWRKEGQD
ncbi:penicillin-binding protein 2 [Terracidiphilus gabretensis]|uniref:penicillin-binding protein 2 n=1 Tax=Terracidiphilus gabretensis TaxID=1577687 RepID=UPI0009E6673F|nr:penicillin-binding protein 2 [Terracidiphilus gabretensis]